MLPCRVSTYAACRRSGVPDLTPGTPGARHPPFRRAAVDGTADQSHHPGIRIRIGTTLLEARASRIGISDASRPVLTLSVEAYI